MSRKRNPSRRSNTSPVNRSYLQPVESVFDTNSLKKTNRDIRPITFNQKRYVKSIKSNVLTICRGLAGTGKTLLALSEGFKLMNREDSPIERIIYIRSNLTIKNEESLGAVKGDLKEKTNTILAGAVLDNLIEFMSEGQAEALIEYGKVLVLPLGLIRGRSFKNSFVIADECQSIDRHGIKAIITRISENSKLVICGDSDQEDIVFLKGDRGLNDAVTRFKDLEDVGICELEQEDIMRHPFLRTIMDRY